MKYKRTIDRFFFFHLEDIFLNDHRNDTLLAAEIENWNFYKLIFEYRSFFIFFVKIRNVKLT